MFCILPVKATKLPLVKIQEPLVAWELRLRIEVVLETVDFGVAVANMGFVQFGSAVVVVEVAPFVLPL